MVVFESWLAPRRQSYYQKTTGKHEFHICNNKAVTPLLSLSEYSSAVFERIFYSLLFLNIKSSFWSMTRTKPRRRATNCLHMTG